MFIKDTDGMESYGIPHRNANRQEIRMARAEETAHITEKKNKG